MKTEEVKIIERRAYTWSNFVANLVISFIISLPLLSMRSQPNFWLYYVFYYTLFLSMLTLHDIHSKFKDFLLDLGKDDRH